MQHQRVNGYDMPYLEVGEGAPLVCIHGSLCDFRVWSPVLGLLTFTRRVIAPSLRHYFPERWDGVGGNFTIAQHVADVIALLEASGPPIDLLGHSRGGHIAFRVAQQRPDLVRRVILAEPGGALDASLAPQAAGAAPSLRSHVAIAAEKIAAGDPEGGLELFIDLLEGPGTWRRLAEAARQELRDNARTLLGQVNENRQPFSKADAEAIRVPMLFIGGGASRDQMLTVLRALAEHVPGARTAIIPNTTHVMFEQDPVRFCEIVAAFLD